MAENYFDNEKIPKTKADKIPESFMLFDDEKVYNIKGKREYWWRCPKCGGNIEFTSCDEGFDDNLGENQFFTVYTWNCEECGAEGSVHAVVNPQYISLPQEDDED